LSYKKKLIDIYNEALKNRDYIDKLSDETKKNIEILANNCFTQKGVYTVFITLAIYKIVHKNQDIRKHQTQIESGWLTRSLEQSYPYTLDYEGKISNKIVKRAFLELLDDIQTKKINSKYILVELLKQIIDIQKKNEIIINPLTNPEKLTIAKLIFTLDRQFAFRYETFGGSKLPVLAFYAIYQLLINEIARYNKCELKSLSSHTASDRTSKSAGDIEIFKYGKLFEAIEIKLDKSIDANMIRIVDLLQNSTCDPHPPIKINQATNKIYS
jgi:DNA (cytosine-5)-methyltransferase 1